MLERLSLPPTPLPNLGQLYIKEDSYQDKTCFASPLTIVTHFVFLLPFIIFLRLQLPYYLVLLTSYCIIFSYLYLLSFSLTLSSFVSLHLYFFVMLTLLGENPIQILSRFFFSIALNILFLKYRIFPIFDSFYLFFLFSPKFF